MRQRESGIDMMVYIPGSSRIKVLEQGGESGGCRLPTGERSAKMPITGSRERVSGGREGGEEAEVRKKEEKAKRHHSKPYLTAILHAS